MTGRCQGAVGVVAVVVASSVLLRHSLRTEQPTSDFTTRFIGRRATALAAAYLLGFGGTGALFVLPVGAGRRPSRQGLTDGVIDVAVLVTTEPASVSDDLVTLADDDRIKPTESVTPPAGTAIVTRSGERLTRFTVAVSNQSTAGLRHPNATVAGRVECDAVAVRWTHLGGPA